MQKILSKIKGLGDFKFEQVSLEDSCLVFYVPLENVNNELKEYIDEDYEYFKSKYPQSQKLNYEIGLLVDSSDTKFDYGILVTYIDNDLDICEFTEILSDYGVTLSTETEREIKKLVLETLKQKMFGE